MLMEQIIEFKGPEPSCRHACTPSTAWLFS